MAWSRGFRAWIRRISALCFSSIDRFTNGCVLYQARNVQLIHGATPGKGLKSAISRDEVVVPRHFISPLQVDASSRRALSNASRAGDLLKASIDRSTNGCVLYQAQNVQSIHRATPGHQSELHFATRNFMNYSQA